MRLKLSCCILLSVAIALAYSKSLASNKKNSKSDAKDAQHPKKRISTQQKLGSGHSKGPMANNVGSNVPLPVVMPFPMIPFDELYPILVSPNKSKKGRGKKKDPKDETEDETDKDVDDENDGGDEQYKSQGKVHEKPKLNITRTHSKELQDDEEAGDEDGQEKPAQQNKVEKISNSKSSKYESTKKINDNKNKDDDDDEVEEEKVKISNSKYEKTNNKEDDEDNEGDDDDNDEDDQKEEKRKDSRTRRSAFEPIIGNPEDIMPYLMLDTYEDPGADSSNEHVINTRSIEDEAELVDDSEIPHVINTRDVNEEEEEDAPRDMRTRSVPDGRSHGHVTFDSRVEIYKKPQILAE